MAAPAKSISTSIGYQDAKGNVVANGLLRLTLSQTATVTATGGQVSTDPIFLPLDVNGKIVTTAIWFSDEVSPTGTIYYGKVYKSDLVGEVPGLNSLQYSITGAGPYDLATAVQSGPASPSYAGAVLLSPSTPQAGNINITGSVTAGSYTNNLSAFAATTSAQLASIISDESGTGALLFGTNNSQTNPTIDTINQKASTTFLLKDNQGGTRYSIPAGGVAQATLNNTNLTGASSSNTVNKIDAQALKGAITGTGAAATMYTVSIPASVVATNASIHVRATFSHSAGSASVTYTLSLNGQSCASFASSVSGVFGIDLDIMNTASTTGQASGFQGATLTAIFNGLTGLAWGSAQTLLLTFNVAATDTVTPASWKVTLDQ